jgi:hypothetical protein
MVFIVAGVSKLASRDEFVEVVRDYDLLPDSLAGPVGRWLPVVEVIIALGLFSGVLAPMVTSVAVLLFVVFGVAVAVNLLRGRRDISCGCFGPQQKYRLTWLLVARNVVFAALAALIALNVLGARGNMRLPIKEAVATMLVAASSLALWWVWGHILAVLRLDLKGGL